MTNDALPRWLRVTYIAIAEYPSTNGIKVNALILVYATGAFLALASMLGSEISEGTLSLWLGLLVAMLGVGAWQQNRKWEQFKPAQPDVENIAATQGTAAATPAHPQKFDRAVAQQVADLTAPKPAAEPKRTDDESGP
jgi:hypothetical protein